VRIAIDLRKLYDFGIGTYVRNLVKQLARIDNETEYVLLCNRDDREFADSLGENFRSISEWSGNYSVSEQFTVPFNIARTRVDIFHAPHYVLPALTPCRSIVTIHDCIHLQFPQYLPNRLAYVYAKSQIWTATRRSSRILTVSEASKQDILRFFRVPDDKVTVIPNAMDERFAHEPTNKAMNRVRERYQLPNRFVMYAGNVKPHKNLERLIDAFMQIRRNGLDDLGLLITGSQVSKYATLRRAVHRYNLHKHVRFLGFQTQDTLAILYRLAEVFVFPSLYEGFGLSPLEAMASGTPVVASNVSSLPEVLGNAAILVDPYDPESIAEGIKRILDSPDVHADMRARGIARARQFSWEQSVKRVRKIYTEVAAGN